MFLLDQKASDVETRIAFAKETISRINSPDDVLSTYLEPLVRWLDVLANSVRQAKANFQDFVRDSSFAQEGFLREEPYRGLLTAILRDFEDIETSLYLNLDTFLPLIIVWKSEKNNADTKRDHKLLMRFISDLLQLCHISESMMGIIGEDYACLPLEWAPVRKHVVFGTYSEIQNLRKWVLLAHELGHVHYHQISERINSSVTPQVIRILNQNRPTNFDPRDFESAIYAWTQHWIPEFVSDCYAVKTFGPAFITQFMVIALDSQPNHVEPTHPPPNLRLRFMMTLLDDLHLSDVDVDTYRRTWQSYAHTVSRPSSLFIVNEEVVAAALSGVDSVVTEKPIKDKWPDILEARKAISEGAVPQQDLISTISALAISEPNYDNPSLYGELLKRYSSNSYVP
jgi:hypothetical protein